MPTSPFISPDSSTQESLTEFWSEIATQTLDWIRPWDLVFSGGFKQGAVQWFQGGLLNVSANCLDRHLATKANHPAIIWEGDAPQQHKILTFAQLHEEVSRMSSVLKKLKVQKGDRVAIYLPMIPEAAVAMLACARIGAVHTVVFAGFSAQALRQRLVASSAKILITTEGYSRGGKEILLRKQANEATKELRIQTLLITHTEQALTHSEHSWQELKHQVSRVCPPEPMEAEDPLFILYTSGSTGQPKGLVHTTGGYLVQAAYTHQLIFNCQPEEVFWCTADLGWITGHSYTIYGSLCNGITSLMYEGIPTWPDAARNWHIIDKHQVNVFYTAPTAIRTLMRAGDHWLQSSSRDSVRLLGSVGEPINPEAWQWYYKQVGKNRCPIVDTWWQTETGAIMMSPRATDTQFKPGAASQPIPGVVPVLLDLEGKELSGSTEGLLAIKYPWPSIARTIAGDHTRYCETYFLGEYYLTGDGARRDADGDYWITGRVDDVVNVSGHRLGTAEIESALVSHAKVSEAGVVGIPDDLKGQAICVFVVLHSAVEANPALQTELINHIKDSISAIAKPEVIYFVDDLPKTRSGKIMRRILRKIAAKEVHSLEELGDLSTLANPQVLEQLMKEIR